MSKNIVLLSDGTGNSAAKLFRTNVWRIYESLDLSQSDQLAYYHDGVGTSSFKLFAAIGGAFGWGLKRNVLDLYVYLCEHYRPGDRIFALGFSRGAFTIRVLVGLIANQGIIANASTKDLPRLAASAYRRYRRTYHTTLHIETLLRLVRDLLLWVADKVTCRQPYSHYEKHLLADRGLTFVGLWDTVDAYGLPIDELREGIDRLVWPLSIPSTEPASIIQKGCHALALDDERQTFHPVLWDETGEPTEEKPAEHIDQERITQVWFAGVHANVGGGYADDRLSHVALSWMMKQAKRYGLKYLPDRREELTEEIDPLGRLYDSRSGFAGYYRYCPRTSMVRDYLPRVVSCTSRFKIHESVFTRIRRDAGYAPIVLPRAYAVVGEDGTIYNVDGTEEPNGADRARRLELQERCWNLVWWKRIAYFVTIAVTGVLLSLPLFGPLPLPNWGITLAGLIGIAGAFLPSFAAPYVTYFRNHPAELIVGGAAIFLLMTVGVKLQIAITDMMRKGWAPGHVATPKPGWGHRAVRSFRTGRFYRTLSIGWSRYFVPWATGLGVILLVVILSARARFEWLSSRGEICAATEPQPLPLDREARSFEFAPNELCHAALVTLEPSKRYRIDVTVPPGGWLDDTIPVTEPNGTSAASEGLSVLQRLVAIAAIPAHRIFRANLLTPIARIGATGADHYVLSTSCTTFTARKAGQLFVFANDVVWPLRIGWSTRSLETGWTAYYSNNRGENATVKISLISNAAPDLINCREDIGMQG